MDFIWNFPLFSIIIFMFTALLCSVLSGKAARMAAICSTSLVCVLNALVVYYCTVNGKSFRYSMGAVGAPWGNEIRGGIVEGLIASGAAFVICMAVIGGAKYIDRDILSKKHNLYYLIINMVGCAVTALIYTNDMFTGYVFLEILTLSSCGILMIRDIGRTTIAATRYLILNLMGSGLFLLGNIFIYGTTGNLLMESIHSQLMLFEKNGEGSIALTISVGLIAVGLGIKSGLFPFHFWMRDTYGSATPSSASVLSGVISKGYLFLLIKVGCRVVGLGSHFLDGSQAVLLVFGMLGVLFGSFGAMREDSINRMLALSSAAQIGYVYVGIGMGSEVAVCAAFLQILSHMITKPLLFMSAARLTEVSKSPRFHDLLGAAKRDPIAGATFSVGAFSMMGVPIFSGFIAKIMFCEAAILEKNNILVWSVLLTLAISTVLNTYYFIRTVIKIFSPHGDDSDNVPVRSRGLVVATVTLCIVNFSVGIFSGQLYEILVRGIQMFS